MGCTAAKPKKEVMGKTEKSIKAALLIQRWYRRHQARLEARRKATWSIFQNIEYAGEQDNFKLYNFFNSVVEQFASDDRQLAMMKAFSEAQHRSLAPRSSEIFTDDAELTAFKNEVKSMVIEAGYDGPKLQFPINKSQIKSLMAAFKSDKVIHAKYLLDLLIRARAALVKLPNINRVSTSYSKQVTICGDLHGQLNDLYIIFHKNGLPAADNPYVFNGDFVDRGENSIEVITLLLVLLLDPTGKIYLNRGNHEDRAMNVRYGFTKEIIKKYKEHATKIATMFDQIFCYLPLGTIIDQKVLVVHGGISEHVDLRFIEKIDRRKYISILRPPGLLDMDPSAEIKLDHLTPREIEEWQQIVDILWSDPRTTEGMVFNTFRGGGCYFGPDITNKVLRRHRLAMLIRSHQCKEEGYEYMHNGRVLTVFSASNYYEDESNKGAYVKYMRQKSATDMPMCQIVQFNALVRSGRRFTLPERISYLESSALNNVKQMIISNRSALEEKFSKSDPSGTGVITAAQWFTAMESVMGVNVPWRTLKDKLVQCDGANVLYNTTFSDLKLTFQKVEINEPSITESLYKHKEVLETIFRTFDKDNSGHISMAEFTEACQILMKHANVKVRPDQIADIARSLDLNKDGHIDFNEFLEAFRIVDSQQNRLMISPSKRNIF
ncbi:serine/threonine-protein phosphatase with EF-hands 2-like [Physella acuta]|uniref:serine/threonine-protein phosphatase with EF-hands 2-like n=1 Tax=Physella acuta TaxID=109671 RepID=UPI0027DABDE6|nr:serine/threonine-protein phosphatase with EF-hands 2-like [Physella acuta]